MSVKVEMYLCRFPVGNENLHPTPYIKLFNFTSMNDKEPGAGKC